MQLSNRLTFSLASFVLILMFGFVVMPVMADDGGTAIPAGGDTANHGTDGHADQAAANTAENNVPGHKHPQIMISAKDSDLTKTGIQVIPTAAAGTTAAEQLAVAFPVEITIPKNAYSGTSGATAPSDSTLSSANTTGMSFIGNGSGGIVALDTFALKANTTYVITAVATVTLVDPAASPTDATAKARRESVLAADTPLEVKVMVTHSVISSSDTRGDYSGQANLPAEMTFTLIPAEVSEKVAWKVTGTPSVTDDFTVTLTADEAGATLMQGDVKVDGGTVIRFGQDPFPPAGKTVYNAEIRPALHARMISVTIDPAAAAAKPAAGDDGKVEASIGEASITDISPNPATANDEADFEVIFTFNRALPNPLMLEHLSIGTMAGASGDMMAGDKANDTVTTAKDPMFLGTPNRVPGESMKWRVTVSPKSKADTIVGLSDAGMMKFSYGTGVKALTVSKKTTVTAGGTVTAAYDATKKETAISVGVIAGNGFAVIDYTDLPDLELFFDIGGTITLHDTDATKNDGNVRSVVMSEILWGLDTGESPVGKDQQKYQFIELYNTTAAPIDLKGWKLVFTPGNVRPAIDIDQVSNRGPGGWLLADGPGKSGRIAGTTADPTTDSLLAPSRIISMYRKINYPQVEKVKADGAPDPDRKKQLEGIPGGNAVGSWDNSVRRSTHRWILSTQGEKHHTTIGVLSASSVAGKPFIVNEIGNDTDGDNDWVEIHNVSDAEASLKNYSLSMVTAKGTDKRLFHFHDQDWKIPAKGFIVISTRHPRDTDLATGKDINVPDEDELNKGLKHLYAVKSGWNLQDDGKFALILRNHQEKQGTAEHLIDVVATRQGSFADTNTSLWPLKVTGQPHENVIDGGDENFAAGKVYKRNGVNNGRGDKSFAVAGYTGIGYDVKASKISVNHGTPGYANNAAQATKAGIGDDMVTISEIMFDVGDAALRRKLPQWIELHNASDTMGVDLNGWKLHIENAAQENGDLETNTFSATVTIGAKFILPNQTIIVASSTGNVRDPNHFPSTRVINLWTNKSHRDALEMARSTDPVLSTRGFSIQLVDKDGAEIDKVGNLDGNRRTRDEPAWPLPVYDTDDRSRSSILRVYEQKVALTGTMADSWKLASDTILAYEVSHAYYGSADDIGSPGYRTGGPLPVSLSKFRPERLDDGTIAVRWVTESELNNAGFNILRSEKRNGEFKQINTKLIAGQGTTSERTTYTHTDTSAKPNIVYYYQIQDVSLDGKVTTLRQTRLKGHISAAGKLTTTWGELKSLQ